MAEGQIDRQVVGVAVPMARALRIDQAEGGRPPAQPGPLANQLDGGAPLGQAGDRQRSLAAVAQIAQPPPDRLRHQLSGGMLQRLRHAGQGGGTDHHQHQQQQGQQPAPAGGAEHQGQGQQERSPGIARIGEQHGRRHGGSHGEEERTGMAAEARLHQGRQCERPGEGQPTAGDVGVVEEAGQATRRVAASLEVPDDRAIQRLERATPAQPELAEAGHHHRHRARHEHPPHAPSRLRGGQIGLESPEGPEKGQPIAQPHPSQPATGGSRGAEHHQQGRQQKHPIGGVRQGLLPVAAAKDQGHQQHQAPQQGAAGQKQQAHLETGPTNGGGSHWTPLSQARLNVARDQRPTHPPSAPQSNTAVRPP